VAHRTSEASRKGEGLHAPARRAQRRAETASWEKIDKRYVFDGPKGKETLPDLFESRSQLVVYHFMFSPDWDEGCASCSFWADSFNDIVVHLNHRDVTFVAISRAPLAKIEPFKQRMGWTFKWLSSGGSDFNQDLQVSFTPDQIQRGAVVYNYEPVDMDMSDREGVSVFCRDPNGDVLHTYSAYARGIDLLNAAYNCLDLVPKGRDEDALDFTQAWVRHHDRYED
jgi:predicted dithiol-disulfide oxidoreductase (DUF899 family)